MGCGGCGKIIGAVAGWAAAFACAAAEPAPSAPVVPAAVDPLGAGGILNVLLSLLLVL